MKIVQIGCAGHAMLAYNTIKSQGWNLSAISAGIRGNAAEGINEAYHSLQAEGFFPKLYTDYKRMLRQENPDLVIINSWFNDNGEILLFALEQGFNAFCEKPIAVSFTMLEKIYLTALKNKVTVFSMFNYRYAAEFIAAKSAIADGKIGKVRMLSSVKSYKLGVRPDFYKSREYYCGILPWVGIHAIDWMSWICGERYISVSAIKSAAENESSGDMDIIATAQFKMTKNIIATLTADMYRPSSATSHGDDRVRIVGTEGIIEIRNRNAHLLTRDSDCLLPTENNGDIFEDFVLKTNSESKDLFTKEAVISTFWAIAADLSANSGMTIDNLCNIGEPLKALIFGS